MNESIQLLIAIVLYYNVVILNERHISNDTLSMIFAYLTYATFVIETLIDAS